MGLWWPFVSYPFLIMFASQNAKYGVFILLSRTWVQVWTRHFLSRSIPLNDSEWWVYNGAIYSMLSLLLFGSYRFIVTSNRPGDIVNKMKTETHLKTVQWIMTRLTLSTPHLGCAFLVLVRSLIGQDIYWLLVRSWWTLERMHLAITFDWHQISSTKMKRYSEINSMIHKYTPYSIMHFVGRGTWVSCLCLRRVDEYAVDRMTKRSI